MRPALCGARASVPAQLGAAAVRVSFRLPCPGLLSCCLVGGRRVYCSSGPIASRNSARAD